MFNLRLHDYAGTSRAGAGAEGTPPIDHERTSTHLSHPPFTQGGMV